MFIIGFSFFHNNCAKKYSIRIKYYLWEYIFILTATIEMPKASKQIIIDAIIREIEQGATRSKVIAKYCKKFQRSARTIDTYWKSANEQHIAKQRVIKEELVKIDKTAAIESRKKEIMTTEERKKYLTDLILGKVTIPYKEVKWNPKTKKFTTIKFVELASHTARISAISELNKMEGDYAPTKVAQTDSKGDDLKDIKSISTSKLLEYLERGNS